MNFYRTKSNSSFDPDVDHREKKITRVLSSYQCCSPSNLTLIQSPRSTVITTDSIERLSLSSSSSSKTINEQLDAIDFLGKYLEHANRDILVDFFSDMARAIRSRPTKMNNHLEYILNRQTNLQRSNNKEKKTKKENDEAKEKKLKKKSEKKKHLDESTTSSEVNTTDSPDTPIAQHSQLKSPKYSSLSTAGSSPYPTLTIPVPQPNFSTSPSPSPSPFFIPQRSNVAQLSQVQQQLQTDTQTSTYQRVSPVPNVSIEEQFRSLSQMAKTDDELLIRLSINPIHPTSHSFPSTSIPPVPMNSSHQLEIVARGFARLQTNDASGPLLSNIQQMPCNSINVPPSNPIGPPIRPIPFDQFYRQCDHCQSSLPQPDFRGRPSPGVLTNPFYRSEQQTHSKKNHMNSSINRTCSSFY